MLFTTGFYEQYTGRLESKYALIEYLRWTFLAATVCQWDRYRELPFVQMGQYYVVGSSHFRPDIQKPRQMENAVRDI